MTEQKKADDGKGVPPGAEGATAEPPAGDARLITGGSFRAARTPIGMNAVDPSDMPSFAKSPDTDYKDTPASDAQRPPHPPEP